MTWLSDEDRAFNKELERSSEFSRSFANGKLTKISVTKHASYPYMSTTVKLDLPRPMTFDEARRYAVSIGHDRISHFYDNKGSGYEEKDYPNGYSNSDWFRYSK